VRTTQNDPTEDRKHTQFNVVSDEFTKRDVPIKAHRVELFRQESKLKVAPAQNDTLRGVRVTDISAGKDSTAVSEITSLLTTIARALVDDAEAVKVEVMTVQDSTVLRLHVSPTDIGKLIGKQGRTARSLRTILGAASMKLQVRFSLDIVEIGRPDGAPRS